MYELLKQKISLELNNENKINKLREYLQIFILKIIFDRGFFSNVAFVGGTALRVLYGMRRYSEDIDFSLINKRNYNFKTFLEQIVFELTKNNFKVATNNKKNKTINSSFIKFPSLLHELGLSKIRSQILSIKLEIDTNPPNGWNLVLTPVTETFVFAVNSFDLPSLYATKLHACFFRRYIKGRDFYDLIWYLGKKIEPNYVLLNNAIKQTEKEDLNINSNNFKHFIGDKLKKINFKLVCKDVERFLEDKNELKLLNREIILKMILT
ncbi:MAG: nucleotidyl transferase AbiEii/AbiGii toxin family protein [Candidatus Firestonebacteria bacterium]